MESALQTLPPYQRVLRSTAFVAEHSQHVQKGPPEQFSKIAKELASTFTTTTFPWASEFHPTELNDSSIQWMFCIDLINFSFWNDPPYAFESYTGYNAFCMQFKKANQTYPTFTQASFLRSLSDDLFLSLFPTIPMANERAQLLRHAGEVLCTNFNGSFSNLVNQSQGSCQTFIELVLHHFPSFRDEAEYQGHKIYFYKRAQILAADLHHLFLLNHQTLFHDIHLLTIFADYRLPQILHHYGLLIYSPLLLSKLNQTWKNGDTMEIELRANSIQVVELLKQTMQQECQFQIVSMDLDFFLWKLAKSIPLSIDFHRVRCCFY